MEKKKCLLTKKNGEQFLPGLKAGVSLLNTDEEEINKPYQMICQPEVDLTRLIKE